MEIKILNIDEIKPYEKNPRKNEKAIEIVAKSIKEFGFKVPVLIDKDNVIIAGHTRIKAAEKLGITEIPTLRIEDLSPEQIKAFRIMDNRSQEYSEWDYGLLKGELDYLKGEGFDISLTGFGHFGETSEDDFDVEKVIENPKYEIKEGELWQLGNHLLLCGDSTKEESYEFIKEKADMVFTDPPFNIGYESQGMRKDKWSMCYGQDNLPKEEYKKFINDCIKNIKTKLKDKRAYYIWAGWNSYQVNFECLENNNLNPSACIIWNKGNPGMGGDFRHQYEMANLGVNTEEEIDDEAEYIFYGFSKEGKGKHFFNKNAFRKRTDIWDIKRDPTAKYNHPTQKPLKLAERGILCSSNENETVLDIFGGSGSTLIACEQLNRNCCMIELNPIFCSVIIERWEKLTNKQAVKIT